MGRLRDAQSKWADNAKKNADKWAANTTDPSAADKRAEKLTLLIQEDVPDFTKDMFLRSNMHTNYVKFQDDLRNRSDAYKRAYNAGIDSAQRGNRWIRGFVVAAGVSPERAATLFPGT